MSAPDAPDAQAEPKASTTPRRPRGRSRRFSKASDVQKTPIRKLRAKLLHQVEPLAPGEVAQAIARFQKLQAVEKAILEDRLLAAEPKTFLDLVTEHGLQLSQVQQLERRVIRRLLGILRAQEKAR